MRPNRTTPSAIVRIPLRARDGSVRAYTTVNASDAAFVMQFRWYLNGEGYAARTDPRRGGKQDHPLLHRILLGLIPGDGLVGDHINRNRLDNRRCNLRAIPKGVNEQNQSSQKGSVSRYRGVSWHKRTQTWWASVQVKGKKVYGKHFHSEEDAAKAVSEARSRLLPYAVETEVV